MLAANSWKRRIQDVRLVPWPRRGVEILEEDKWCVLLVVVVKSPLLELKEVVVVGWEEKRSSNGSEHHPATKEAVEGANPAE
jgi:hypothetical protein